MFTLREEVPKKHPFSSKLGLGVPTWDPLAQIYFDTSGKKMKYGRPPCPNWFCTFYFWDKSKSKKAAQIARWGGGFGRCPKEKMFFSGTSSLYNLEICKKVHTCSPAHRKLGTQDIPKDHSHSHDTFSGEIFTHESVVSWVTLDRQWFLQDDNHIHPQEGELWVSLLGCSLVVEAWLCSLDSRLTQVSCRSSTTCLTLCSHRRSRWAAAPRSKLLRGRWWRGPWSRIPSNPLRVGGRAGCRPEWAKK